MKPFAYLLILLGVSCTSVKEYEKSKINDADMALTSKKTEKFFFLKKHVFFKICNLMR
jgi:hypothetical protein